LSRYPPEPVWIINFSATNLAIELSHDLDQVDLYKLNLIRPLFKSCLQTTKQTKKKLIQLRECNIKGDAN